MSHLDLSDSNFEKEVLESSEPVLVDFWAAWCAPCKKLAPVIDELATSYGGRIKVAKLNVDEASMVAARYGIKSIPTVILFKNGKPVEQIVGLQPRDSFAKLIDQHLA